MRDASRIDEFMDSVGELWRTYAPDMRFGQLMIAFNDWHQRHFHRDIFYLEEDELLTRFEEFLGPDKVTSQQKRARSEMEANKSEMQAMFDELYEELDGVLPDEVLTVAKEVQPIEVGVKLLWDLGGRIREKQPGINLTEPYAYPPEAEGLNDEIDGYSFEIASFPLDALAKAARANINADEEIIQSRDLEGFVPLIISQEGEVRKIALVDCNDHKLEVPLDIGFGINIEMDGDIGENQEAIKGGLRQLAENLETLKQDIAKHPSPFDSPEEEDAIRKWCNKHSYELFPVIRSSIDLYH